ncbi:hypothetical protein LMH73_008230 [Vibrio splendidus]|nr:hypothetical protein [Vibrio splendidus]MCC4880526.1 hypothetical protein [Vibrio splendidus]
MSNIIGIKITKAENAALVDSFWMLDKKAGLARCLSSNDDALLPAQSIISITSEQAHDINIEYIEIPLNA